MLDERGRILRVVSLEGDEKRKVKAPREKLNRGGIFPRPPKFNLKSRVYQRKGMAFRSEYLALAPKVIAAIARCGGAVQRVH